MRNSSTPSELGGIIASHDQLKVRTYLWSNGDSKNLQGRLAVVTAEKRAIADELEGMRCEINRM